MGDREIVILLREISKKESFYLKNNDHEGLLVIDSKTENTVGELVTKGNYKNLSHIASSIIEDIDEEIFNKVIDFGHKEVNGEKVIEMLSFNNSFFWYYIRFSLYYKSRLPIKEVRLLRSILKEIKLEVYNPKMISIFCSSPLLKSLKGNLSVSVPIDFVLNNSSSRTICTKYINAFVYFVVFFIRSFIGFLSALFQKGKNNILIYLNINNKQTIYSSKDKGIIKGNNNIGYLIEKFELLKKKDFFVLSEFFVYSFNKKLKISLRDLVPRRRREIFYEAFLLITLLSPVTYLRLMKLNQQLKRTSVHRRYIDCIEDQVLLYNIFSLRKMILISFLRELAFETLLKIMKVKVVVSEGESNLSAKSIMEPAKRSMVKTVGVQHGIIHKKHMHYTFSKEDANYKPWPDFMILWGGYWKDQIIKFSSIEKEKLIVLGQLRTDTIAKIRSKIPLHNIKARQYKSNTQFTVLYASQKHQEGESKLRLKLANDFFKLAKLMDDSFFIIKPHPEEKDLSFFHNLAFKMKVKNYSIEQGELYLLLNKCDVLITYHSTVGTEAIYFDKNLVVMNYHNNDNPGYIEAGVAFEAKNYNDLEKIIKKIKKKEIQLDCVKKKEFVEYRACEIDSSVAERYIGFIYSL